MTNFVVRTMTIALKVRARVYIEEQSFASDCNSTFSNVLCTVGLGVSSVFFIIVIE